MQLQTSHFLGCAPPVTAGAAGGAVRLEVTLPTGAKIEMQGGSDESLWAKGCARCCRLQLQLVTRGPGRDGGVMDAECKIQGHAPNCSLDLRDDNLRGGFLLSGWRFYGSMTQMTCVSHSTASASATNLVFDVGRAFVCDILFEINHPFSHPEPVTVASTGLPT